MFIYLHSQAMGDIPVNKPDECTNHTTDDIPASQSRDCGSSVQVKNEQLQYRGLKSMLSNSLFYSH